MDIPLRCAIVIPAYNHGAQVRGVVEKCLQLQLPVIVVDDGSTDSTPSVLASLSGVTVIHHKENQGKGASLLTGFAAALPFADWAITIDADGQHDPEDILSLISLISVIGAVPEGQRPLVIGKRDGNGTWKRTLDQPLGPKIRQLLGLDLMREMAFRFTVRISGLPPSRNPATWDRARRYQFEVEVLVRAVWFGIRIIEAPVHVLYGSPGERVSHFRPWLDFWRNTRTFTRLIATRILIPSKLRSSNSKH